MRSQATTQDDYALGLSPSAPEVTAVKVISHLKLQVQFADGLSGLVCFESSHLTGVFAALQEPAFFQQVSVLNGAVTWPGDLDLAPDAMYDAIQLHQEWVLQ